MKTKSPKERKPKPEPQTTDRQIWPWALGLLAALFAAFQVYGPALHGPFLFDDSYLPMNVPAWQNSPFLDSFRGVRPLLMASYWINNHMSPAGDTSQFHEWNVLFHFLNAALVYLVLRKLLDFAGAPRLLAIFGAGLFLLHPLATEAVAYIAGRSDAMSSTFFLGAFTLFLYRPSPAIGWGYAAGVMALFVAAMGAKENTVVLPAVLLLTDYFWNPGFSFEGIRKNWRLYAPMAAGGLVGAVAVFRVLGGAESAGFSMKDLRWYEYLFTQFRVFWIYLRLFVFPAGQTVDYDIPISHSVLDHGAIAGLIGICALLGAAWFFRRRYPLACYGLLIFVVVIAPTSSIIPIKDPISERRAYLPMIGLLLVAIEILRRLPVRRQALVAGLGAVLMIAGVLTWQRAAAWSGAIPLWDDAARKSPRKARAHFQLGYAYYAEGRCQEADQQYQTVAEIEKPDYRLLVDWALVDDCLHKSDAAMKKYQQAAAIEKTAHVYSQIARMYAQAGQTNAALEALSTAQSIDPSFETTYIYRGQILQGMNNLPAAQQEYQRALAINPRNEQALMALQQLQAHLRMRQ